MDRPFGNATVSNNPFGKASPILLLGVILLIGPMIFSAVGWQLPLKSVFYVVGVLLILAGAVHSAMKD